MKKLDPADYIKLSTGEEVGNSVTHGVMAMILLFLLPIVSVSAYIKGGWILAIGLAIFMISLFLMFMGSCLYHAMAPDSKHKEIMRILDHIFIYVAIAGSYTPVALILIKGWQGVLVLVVQWSMVIFGILYKSLSKKRMPKASVTIYLLMGWTAVLFMPTLLRTANPWFLGFLALGGIFYSVGAWFYGQKHRPYFHFIWHIFVNLAATSHFIGMLFFIN